MKKNIEEIIKRKSFQIRLLKAAEVQFRLASAVRLATTSKRQPLDLPIEWSHGKHKVKYKEIALSHEEADWAACDMHRATTYLMAVQIRNAVKNIFQDPRNHKNENIRSTYQIARLIRNAFAHQPFHPIWVIDEDCKDKIFEIKNIIKLDTHNLDGECFDWHHYGGTLALLRLSQFTRKNILEEPEIPAENVKYPTKSDVIYYQQGNLLLRKVDKIAKTII